MKSQTKSQFIAVASITSELSAVVAISKEISLAASNAKAVAFRAGDKAKGFQPITDFISDLAKEMIQEITVINELAMALCRSNIKQYRKTEAFNRISQAAVTAGTAAYADSIRETLADAKKILQNFQILFGHDVPLLLDHLESVAQHARTAKIISTYFRIEASHSGEYLQSLLTVSKSIDNAAQKIHDHVQRCIMALSLFDAIKEKTERPNAARA